MSPPSRARSLTWQLRGCLLLAAFVLTLVPLLQGVANEVSKVLHSGNASMQDRPFALQPDVQTEPEEMPDAELSENAPEGEEEEEEEPPPDSQLLSASSFESSAELPEEGPEEEPPPDSQLRSASSSPLSSTDAPESETLAPAPKANVGGGKSQVHVCLSTDDEDLRPVAVAIKSTVASARDPGRLVFHVITTPEQAPSFLHRLRQEIRGIQIQVHHDALLADEISALITYRKSSEARKVLASPFNFAPFYLDRFLKIHKAASQRLIYMDTDVMINGDIGELYDIDLNGHPVAAVKDCTQRLDTYINGKEMKKAGVPSADLNLNACVFNRGLFVMDTKKWRELALTTQIEGWMKLFKESKRDIYKFGMSQPPWLLAVRGHYRNLGAEWNCRGLGREYVNPPEIKEYKRLGFTKKTMRALGAKRGSSGWWAPYVAPCTATGKLLHFNGALKPWKRDKWRKNSKAPLCALPPDIDTRGAKVTKVGAYVPCYELWWEHLSDASAGKLAGKPAT